MSHLGIDTIRTLSMDAVQAANSGHPGTPMALAPVAYQLWTNVLRYDPSAPHWPNRDRYVLSCGHASMLIYSLLHLAEVRRVDQRGQVSDELSVTLEAIRNFRQWGSSTPGHPETGHTTGVETTTGPLGQGCGNSVGMAIASRWLAARYNKPDFELFDFDVYAQCSDGDLMEGVACEAASLAGHLKLSNLCWIYDDNRITIEGSTDLAFSEDVATRFRGLGWNVLSVGDPNDLAALDAAYAAFRDCNAGPTLIIVSTVIGYGAPNKADTSSAHGEPLGEEEIKLTKEAYGLPPDEKFRVPDEAYAEFRNSIGKRGREARQQWESTFAGYRQAHPELAQELNLIFTRELPDGWDADAPEFPADEKGGATRAWGGKALNALAPRIPWLVGGSADLAPSTKTLLTFEEAGSFQAGAYDGRNFHFGIREHAMAAAVNGMTLSGLRGFGATFFVFSDYLRPSLRLAAIMGTPSIFVFTHDSIGVGEDGPTHQPVEQLAAVRGMPNVVVIRPGDANETVEAWRLALQQTDRPACLVLTRQALPTLDRSQYAPAAGAVRGGYVLADAKDGQPDLILMATGSELSLAVDAYRQLTNEGVRARVVSMPSLEVFAEQEPAYRDEVLPPDVVARVAVEAGVRQGWDLYLGAQGQFVGMDRYGASAPAKKVFAEMGFTVEQVVEAARTALA